ncbi:hypothetical protein NLG97_g11209 [Lecanicillium saksenae]|uniref:Uncharacterized protein n=1 Tax=Lecanicillium saksenae TaxID=468837 RepID=A0ACC1QBI8_9HYPO|nr:hypothetical protein NLG97_g11209 [Lecanicillium saksenae]
MTSGKEQIELLSLPVELRLLIILEVLKSRRKEPALTKKLIDGRVQLRNRFDATRPEMTNIYVQRHKNRYLHGNGLLATCRRLRQETLLLIDTQIKTGRVKMPFVLDVMFVKDVGIIPTWLSFPYTPTTGRIRKLAVNVRIVRPGTHVVPADWIEAARYNRPRRCGTCWWSCSCTR